MAMDWPATPAKLIGRSAVQSGLSRNRPEDIAFYVQAYLDDPMSFHHVRKRGTPMPRAETKSMGIAFKGILTREFLDTLNDDGLADPIYADHLITRVASNWIHCLKRLNNAKMAGITKFEFLPSQMLAGPCPKAALLAHTQIGIGAVDLVPFDDCSHPGQCACMYRSVLDFDDMDWDDDEEVCDRGSDNSRGDSAPSLFSRIISAIFGGGGRS